MVYIPVMVQLSSVRCKVFLFSVLHNCVFSQALSSLRQKIRKYLKDFEAEITKYREVSGV